MLCATRPRNGLSLADLLIGLGALIPILMILAGSFPVAHLVGKRAWCLATAQQLASAQLEQLRAQPVDQLPALSVNDQSQRGQDFHTTVQVQSVPGLPPALKQATVLVQWHLRGDESFQLVTYLAQTAP